MASKNRLTINLAADECQALADLASQRRVSKAWLGRQAIIELLERYQCEKVMPPLDSSPNSRKLADNEQ